MKVSNKKHTNNWKSPLVALITTQIIFFLLDTSPWTPKFRDFDGKVFGRVVESKFFTEWFTLYNIPELNVFTAFFVVTLLPFAILKAIQDIAARRRFSG